VPGKKAQAQQLMRTGATMALGFIFAAGILGAFIGKDDGADWGRLAVVLLIGFITFGTPPLWKWLNRGNGK